MLLVHYGSLAGQPIFPWAHSQQLSPPFLFTLCKAALIISIARPSLALSQLSAMAGALGEVMAQLRSLGFGDDDAQDAAAITLAQGRRPDLEAALDWLCVHVPEGRLPAKFAAGEPSTMLCRPWPLPSSVAEYLRCPWC